ncbi:MAG: DUF1472 domain-containing protein [Candidatus Accumulibacter meliphilus]|uniref:DUF1472 domain-containing protein n=1 Tax=Candidatus Accumulibacter meliphilus TaxID=2211374 RepID=A0A369XM06_9PROT|nr:MAG: DUF1472 domain-containing protein [Candidatus Accumulibacter meliphilus]
MVCRMGCLGLRSGVMSGLRKQAATIGQVALPRPGPYCVGVLARPCRTRAPPGERFRRASRNVRCRCKEAVMVFIIRVSRQVITVRPMIFAGCCLRLDLK